MTKLRLVAAIVVGALVLAATAAIASRTAEGGGSITGVKFVTENDAATTSSTSYVDLPGATTKIRVPRGQRALISARFSAESRCSGGIDGNWCSVKILIGRKQGHPRSGSDFAFDAVGASDDRWESNSMERYRGPVGPGRYRVRVQWLVTDAATEFRLDDWTLSVQRART